MNAITQKDHKRFARRIAPHRRAGETCMAKRSEWKQFTAIRREGGVHVPPEPACATATRNDSRPRHFSNSQRREDAHAAKRSAVENHLAVDCQIAGGGKESGMSGNSVHAI